MDFKTLLKLRAANNRLPDNSFFACKGVEVWDFVSAPKPGLLLRDDSWLPINKVNISEFEFYFDS